jgi:hypothetical protein
MIHRMGLLFWQFWYMINRKPPSWMTQVTWSTLVDCLRAESPLTCGLGAFWPGDNLLVWSGHLDHPLGWFSYFISDSLWRIRSRYVLDLGLKKVFTSVPRIQMYGLFRASIWRDSSVPVMACSWTAEIVHQCLLWHVLGPRSAEIWHVHGSVDIGHFADMMFTACLLQHSQNLTRTNRFSGLIRNSYLLNKQMIIDNSCFGFFGCQDQREWLDIWIRDYNPPRCFQKKISGRGKHNWCLEW